jgi:hypothetical protein
VEPQDAAQPSGPYTTYCFRFIKKPSASKGKEEKMATIHYKGNKYGNDGCDMFLFVASAMPGKKDGRDHLMQLYYEAKKKRLWATDGFRMHLAHIDMGESNRQFKVLIQKRNEIMMEDIPEKEFNGMPNISSVLSDIIPIARQDIKINPKEPENGYIALMRLFQKAIIKQAFFNCLSIFSDCWTALIQDGEESPIYFKNSNCVAVIMPKIEK